MKRASWIVIMLAVFTAGQIAVNARSSFTASNSPTTQEPQISGVRLKGKKLWVIGESFSAGATILIDGEAVGTINDPDNPAGMLFAKRGGRKVPDEKTVAISVQNAGGVTSQAFDFFSGTTITIDDGGKTVNLKVGEKFEVMLKKENYDWSVTSFDQNLIVKLTSEPAAAGSQGIFQAVKAGRTQLVADGELPCHKTNPPCAAPSLEFEVTLVIN